MVEEINGNIIELFKEGQFDVIAHGCNAFCTMGAGLALQIKREFPEAHDVDCQTYSGDETKMGTFSEVDIDGLGKILNLYTQYHWKGKGSKIDYGAVRCCMKLIKEKYSGLKIALPQIGAGLAGGDWDSIMEIIEDELRDEDITIVIYA